MAVVKRDGSSEPFDRQKLLRGLTRAAGKRPVSEQQLEALADSIASAARRAGPAVRADQIGDLAERGLARLDPVAAIQFASVYRDLADLDELEAVVRRFKRSPSREPTKWPWKGPRRRPPEARPVRPIPRQYRSFPLRPPANSRETRRTHV